MAQQPTSTPYQTVLFDLDGTLIDHFRVIYRCYCYALEQLGLEPVDYDTVLRSVGGSIPVTFGKLVPQEYVAEGVKHFRERFAETWHEDIHILPGTEWLLESLKNHGLKLAVFTNKDGDFARKVVEHIRLDRWIDTTVGAGDTAWRKPQPEFTRHVLQQLDADAGLACLIGDSPYDAEAAAVVSMDRFLVATGSHRLDELKKVEPQGAYPNLTELGASVFGLEAPLAPMPE